jgi:putative phosphoesterase
MRIALLSDVHGNAIALDVCLKRVRILGVDAVYFLGDAVGYLPAAREVLDRLEQESIPCQQGNHERMLLSPAEVTAEREETYRLGKARAELVPAHLQRIAAWPTQRELTLGPRSILLVHGSPKAPLDGYVYPDTDLTDFHDIRYDVVIMGHTHRPFVRESGCKLFVNTGSVGLPRDRGDLAAFAVYDAQTRTAEIVRIELDVNAILAAYGDQVAESVRACLRRKS